MYDRTLLAVLLVGCLVGATPAVGAGTPSGDGDANGTVQATIEESVDDAVDDADGTIDAVDGATDVADRADSTTGDDRIDDGVRRVDAAGAADAGSTGVNVSLRHRHGPLGDLIEAIETGTLPVANASGGPPLEETCLEELACLDAFPAPPSFEHPKVLDLSVLADDEGIPAPLDRPTVAVDATEPSADADEGAEPVPATVADGQRATDVSDDEASGTGDDGDDRDSTPGGLPGVIVLGLERYSLLVGSTAVLSGMGYRRLASGAQGLFDPGALWPRAVPLIPLLGASRRADADTLENETRAAIYDLVSESPGIYFAKLAGETGVTEETVRYHSRVLADEGLVERRKIRGRRRLFPVELDGREAELAAAMVDSAASDVLSAIERLEPTTLSALASALECAPSTVAHHLDRLEEDGLVTRDRDGVSVSIRLHGTTRSALQGSVADD